MTVTVVVQVSVLPWLSVTRWMSTECRPSRPPYWRMQTVSLRRVHCREERANSRENESCRSQEFRPPKLMSPKSLLCSNAAIHLTTVQTETETDANTETDIKTTTTATNQPELS